MAAGVLSEAVMMRTLDNTQTPNAALIRQVLRSQSSAGQFVNLQSMIEQSSMQGDGVRIDKPAGVRALLSFRPELFNAFLQPSNASSEADMLVRSKNDKDLAYFRR